MQFSDLNLNPQLLKALVAEGYSEPTPIQQTAIPPVLAGRDLLGIAQTGTGKTAAFALPILQRLAENPPVRARAIRVLVLTPTRELAAQIGESFSAYGRHLRSKNTVIFGGVSQHNQTRALRLSPEILIATPGRLLDLCNQKIVDLSAVEILVLDEADRMLDMGFIHDVRRVIGLVPRKRQTLFFSATMAPDIESLADQILSSPERVEVTPRAKTADKIEQRVYFVQKLDKRQLLEDVLANAEFERVLVFTRTKHGADRVAKQLARANVSAAAIHGNKSQNARERALNSFKRGETRVLVATDIAARGIDIDGISHVINYDIPNIPESYVHRIGRTARAGASGMALSFCDPEERGHLAGIEKLLRFRLPVVGERPAWLDAPVERTEPRGGWRPRPNRGSHPGHRNGGGGGGGRGGGGGQREARPARW
jgi:ATP-dependent RNA helicase RhlE